MLIVELLELGRTHRPLPTYVVDEMQHGHRDCDPVAPIVSVSFLNVRFDRASFPFSIAQISSFECHS